MYLAQYSIRSKQAYIFRTNAMVEMAGASVLISDAFDRLYDACDKVGVKIERVKDTGKPFALAAVREAFKTQDYRAVELFCGGGNATVLFDSRESFVKANREYTFGLEKDCPGMIPLCVGVEIDDQADDYMGDYAKLMAETDRKKRAMTSAEAIPVLPFCLMDRKTFTPVVGVQKIEKDTVELTAEAWAKRKVGQSDKDRITLEDLAAEKGKNSLLAVVHCDGNSMGVKIQTLLGHEDRTYDHCVNVMRDFSKKVDHVFCEIGKQAVDDLQKKRRWLICDGDDATFVCGALDAKELTTAYLKAVADAGGFSSCAGICICHNHYPFHMAYEMAEQACDNAKKRMHESAGENAEESWIDFHFIHSGLQGDLADIRERQGTADRMARPLRLGAGREAGVPTVEELDRLSEWFRSGTDTQDDKVTRGNLKNLGAALETSQAEGKKELARVFYRLPQLKDELEQLGDGEKQLRMIYDLSEIYDLWYS